MCWDFDETCHKHLASRWELLKGFSNKRSKVRVVCVNATEIKGQGRMCKCYRGQRSGSYMWMLQRSKVRVVCVNATEVKGHDRMCECYSSGERSRSYVWMLQQWWKVRVICVNATVVKGQGRVCECYRGQRSGSYVWMLQWWKVRAVCVNATEVKGQGRMCECYSGQRSGSYVWMLQQWWKVTVVCVNATAVVKGQGRMCECYSSGERSGRMCECYSGERSGSYVWMLQRSKVRVVHFNGVVLRLTCSLNVSVVIVVSFNYSSKLNRWCYTVKHFAK